MIPASANPLFLSSDAPTGYNLSKSLRLRSSASAYLSRTPASAGNQQKFTFSTWFKLGTSSVQVLFNQRTGTNNTFGSLQIYSSNRVEFTTYSSGSQQCYLLTKANLRDFSAWYHIVVSVDTTQATDSNRIKLYINGSQVTVFDSATYPSQNANLGMNTTDPMRLGADTANSAYYDGYLAETIFVNASQEPVTSFGEIDSITGVWKPKAFSGTYGTNGFYLPFTDVATTSGSNAGLGKDFSGNGNYWNTTNISVTSGVTYDSMKDVPTLTDENTANYAVLNPLSKNGNATLSNGNLTVYTASNDINFTASTIAILPNTKVYWEQTCQTNTGANFYQAAGIWSVRQWTSYDTGSYSEYYLYAAGATFNNGASGSSSYGATWTNGDVIGVAVDMVNGTLTFYKNGVSQGVASTTFDKTLTYFANVYTYTTQASLNFGQRPFAYTPPTGFKPLNSYNLPDSNIVAGNAYMDVTTYTGNATARSIVNSGAMSPDLVWIKNRSQAYSHRLFDTIRGAENRIFSDQLSAEGASVGSLTAFNSNGFSLGVDTAGPAGYGVNENNSAFVAWQWRASDSSAVSNTAGSITSTVSVNTTAGFSIAKFNSGSAGNQSFGHGLGVAPSLVLLKDTGNAYNWIVYHSSVISATNQYLVLNADVAISSYSGIWGSALPTSSVINFGSGQAVNSNSNCVAYCWSEVAGFSKFGKYTGNGSADGAFVYTGFRPKFILLKRTDTSGYNWVLFDTTRSTYNAVSKYLQPNLSNAEGDDGIGSGSWNLDFLSNGFKLRATAENTVNANGATMIYAAFAENPFKNSLAR